MRTVRLAAGSSEVFLDDRGPERVLRMSWHAEHRIVVLSLWNGNQCMATFRLPVAQVPVVVQALTSGLAELAHAAEVGAARRDAVVRELWNEPAQPAPLPGQHTTGRASRVSVRAMDAVIRGCTRLRDRLDRR
ncbi:hypothetical protein [Haloactinomyces albus]|uniref:Uncharacterized protein n=1 Tax=Haloactinomyces albus TaxID=1352928 RepID=A0AAE3ZA86_9ACTN|nr:hypothetical protein [Haloactinomyces albus]MDR7300185.1 hypothetical protein [Haloactinomyces albus]